MAKDISDIYIKGKFDPNYDKFKVENVTFIDTVVAKIYMILMTNKGEIFGSPDFGADIPKYLWKTKFPASTIEANIIEQFAQYIPELSIGDYKITVYILPGKTQDIGVVNIDLGVTSVSTLFK
jgi:hypothetical protein